MAARGEAAGPEPREDEGQEDEDEEEDENLAVPGVPEWHDGESRFGTEPGGEDEAAHYGEA